MKEFYTDGSCSVNPGPGGYGIISLNRDKNRIDYYYSSDREQNTTNNRQELKAILHVLHMIQGFEDEFIIYSDSAYCVNMYNNWISTWARNGWKNSKKVEVENIDLVKQLYEYKKIEFPNFSIQKVKGHNGLIENELADALATKNMDKFTKILKKNNIFFS